MEIGTIKEIDISSGRFTAIVDIGNNVSRPAILYNSPNITSAPLVGDFVAISVSGSEYIILAVFSNVESPEGGTKIYSRDADGIVVASFELKNDGSHMGQNESGFYELTKGGIFRANNFEARPSDPEESP